MAGPIVTRECQGGSSRAFSLTIPLKYLQNKAAVIPAPNNTAVQLCNNYMPSLVPRPSLGVWEQDHLCGVVKHTSLSPRPQTNCGMDCSQ